jgi:uncharacterized protein with PQ loop repeat
MIQDKLLFICGIIFLITLIPQLLKIHKYKSTKDFSWITTASTFVILLVQSIIFYTIDLYFSAFTMILTGLCWGYILVAKIKWDKIDNKRN